MRPTKTITLPSGVEVTLKDGLTWGERENLRLEIQKGIKIGQAGIEGFDTNAIMEEKYKTLETVIVDMKNVDKTALPFTREWMNNLDADEGDALVKAVNDVTTKKKEASTPTPSSAS